MKIARAELTRVRLRLRTPVATARGLIERREGVVLALGGDAALVGYGEALPLAEFGGESPDQSYEALSRLARSLIGEEIEALDALLDRIEALAPEAPAARAAADVALFDLAARTEGIGVAALLARPDPPRSAIEVNALLHAERPEHVAREASVAVAAGYRTLKLKVGAGSLALDEARVAAARDAVGGEVKIRLDANGGWTEHEAEGAIACLARYRIEMLEQPVEPRDLDGLARLAAISVIPIAADEALDGGRAVDAIFACAAAKILVLKPAALGGLRASRRIASRARAAGLAVVVTSALDSALGRTAALQLAASLGGPQLAAGLATGALLERDLADAPSPVDGALRVPEAPGIGVAPSRDALARCALANAEAIAT